MKESAVIKKLSKTTSNAFSLAGTSRINTQPKLHKEGFTLAEVLITLGIIGIVSALTLPVLIQNINGHKYRNQFKKSFSTLSQAVKLAQEQYELTFAMLDQTCEDTGADANPRSNRSMCALLNGTLKGASYVGQASEIYGNKDIKIGDYPISDYLVYRLSDGSLVGFYKDLKTCTVPTGTQLTESVLTGSGALKNCLGFIDVNGDKNPNDLVQGTTADSISWLFGLPVAYGYGYGYDDGYGDDGSPCGEGECWNSKGEHCYGDCPDDYVYTWSEFHSQAKYNSQGQRGIGDEYIYGLNDIYGCCNITDNGINCSENGALNFSDFEYCYNNTENYHIIACKTKSNETKLIYDFADSTIVRKIDSLGLFTTQSDNNSSNYGYSYNFEYGNGNTNSCSSSSFDPSARCTVPNRSGFISDIFPIVFHDGVVEPASGPARTVLHQAK